MIKNKIEGCLFGHFVGDYLGGVTKNNLIEGQYANNSEMAVSLIWSLKNKKDYNKLETMQWYKKWIKTNPFYCDTVVYNALLYDSFYDEQSNGSLVRCFPLAIKFNKREDNYISYIAEEDCKITHKNKICIDCNKIYTVLLVHLLNEENPENIIDYLFSGFIEKNNISQEVISTIERSLHLLPSNFEYKENNVLTSMNIALYNLINNISYKDAIEKILITCDDKSSNACITGCLLGAYQGIDAIPINWVNSVKNCKPIYTNNNCLYPRPDWLFPCNYKDMLFSLSY